MLLKTTNSPFSVFICNLPRTPVNTCRRKRGLLHVTIKSHRRIGQIRIQWFSISVFEKKTPRFQESNNLLELFSILIEVLSIFVTELVLSGGIQPLSQKQSTKQVVIIESFPTVVEDNKTYTQKLFFPICYQLCFNI